MSSSTECLQGVTQIGLSLNGDICGWDPEYSAIGEVPSAIARSALPRKKP